MEYPRVASHRNPLAFDEADARQRRPMFVIETAIHETVAKIIARIKCRPSGIGGEDFLQQSLISLVFPGFGQAGPQISPQIQKGIFNLTPIGNQRAAIDDGNGRVVGLGLSRSVYCADRTVRSQNLKRRGYSVMPILFNPRAPSIALFWGAPCRWAPLGSHLCQIAAIRPRGW